MKSAGLARTMDLWIWHRRPQWSCMRAAHLLVAVLLIRPTCSILLCSALVGVVEDADVQEARVAVL